jgi:hypothetical protein
MFNRKKPRAEEPIGVAQPRGRTGAASPQAGQNPLARRFLDDAEPDTVDLAEPGRYHAATGDEPETRETGVSAAAADTRRSLLTLDAVTGKFYLQPGCEDHPVRLNGVVVKTPSELRRGDRLQIGDHEFEFLA